MNQRQEHILPSCAAVNNNTVHTQSSGDFFAHPFRIDFCMPTKPTPGERARKVSVPCRQALACITVNIHIDNGNVFTGSWSDYIQNEEINAGSLTHTHTPTLALGYFSEGRISYQYDFWFLLQAFQNNQFLLPIIFLRGSSTVDTQQRLPLWNANRSIILHKVSIIKKSTSELCFQATIACLKW